MGRKHSHPMQATTSPAADDFTLIKGIGPILAARLHEIDILTFAQLAELSPADIATRLGGLSAGRIAKEKWISQARNLAPKRPSAHRQTNTTAGEIRQHYATFTVELLLDADNSVRRTRVTQVQTEAEETWPGWQDTRLIDFFIQRARLCISRPKPVPLLDSTSPSQASPHAQSATQLPSPETETDLGGILRVCDLTTRSLDSNVPQNSVHVGETFNVHVVLDLTEVKRSAEVPLSYVATIWAKKLGAAARQIVGEARGTFTPIDKATCTVQVAINSQGIYRLEALVTLTEQGKKSSAQQSLMAMQRSNPMLVF